VGGEDATRVSNGPSRRRLKVYREFDVQNRMEGTVGYFTVPVPIGIDTNSQSTLEKIVKAKF
jgi:hypothetical protein